MTNLHEVLSMPHENISEAANLLKVLSALPPLFSLALVVVGSIATYFLKRNTAVTKKNTEVVENNTCSNEAVTDLMDIHKAELEKLHKDSAKQFAEILGGAKNELLDEINKVKIVMVKVNAAADQKLSMIPQVEKAFEARITKMEEDQLVQTANTQTILTGLQKLKDQK